MLFSAAKMPKMTYYGLTAKGKKEYIGQEYNIIHLRMHWSWDVNSLYYFS